jgi:outer membrane lipoprotein SlyB
MSRLTRMRRHSRRLALSAMVAGLLLAAATLAAQSNTVQSVNYGTIVSAEAVTIQDKPSGKKQRGGAAVGAVAGAAVAGHGDRWFGALVGGVAGAAVGGAADKAGSVKKGTELIIKVEKSGEEIAIQVPGEQKFQPGDRVRLTSGPSGTKVQKVEPEASAPQEQKKGA